MREDILSLSVGKSVYPEDGLDAEKLLTEADLACTPKSKASRPAKTAACIRGPKDG